MNSRHSRDKVQTALSPNNNLKRLFFVCQIFLFSSFILLGGCGGGGGGSTTTGNTTPTTTTSSIDETLVFEGFKYLNTAKGVDPRQQEAALSRISGITNAKCDGYECSFTFSGREAVFIYPVVESNSSTASSLNAANMSDSNTLTDQKKHLVFSKKNTLSSLSDNRIV